ncbi:TPA: hypothetical protein ACNU17_003056 [Aeromonas salmonicida subsp. pectinolytica]
MKQSKFIIQRGASFRHIVSWDEIGTVADNAKRIILRDITKDGMTTIARFECDITYEGVVIKLSYVECSRLRGLNKFNVALETVDGEGLSVCWGYIEIR